MIPIISLIQTYGYLAVFVGSIFEGETIVILGGLASHESHLSYPLVALCAALGAIVGDWSFFFLGRYKKAVLFKRFSRLERMMRRPAAIVEKRPRLMSLSMRFMYGFRHVVPISIGASRVPAKEFLVWNGIGAVLWALAFTAAGYVAGNVLETVIGDIKRYEFRIIVFSVLTFSALWGGGRLVRMFLRRIPE